MRPSSIRPLVFAIAALSALTACGKNDPSPPEGLDPAPQVNTKPPERPLYDNALESVCGEKAEPRTKAFDAKAVRLHPMLIFARDGDAGKWLIDHPSILDDWKAEKAADYELVACVTKKSRKKVNECAFAQKQPTRYLEIYDATYEINIHETSTGKKIASKTVELPASVKECPMMWMFRGERDASEPKFTYALMDLARPLVMPPGAAIEPKANPRTLFDSDLQKVCSEIPERRAAPFEKKPGELHPMMVFQRDGVTSDFGSSFQSEFQPFKTEKPEGYKLVACVTEKSRKKVKECKFDEKKPARFVDLYDATVQMDLFEAATAKKLASKEVALKASGGCPTIWMFHGERDASVPGYTDQLIAFVKPFAGSPPAK